jgi:hypothetical protein
MLDMNGVKYSNEYHTRSKINKKAKILPKARSWSAIRTFHLTVIDGNVYQIKTKNKIRNKTFNLSNGVVVNPDGTYQKRIRNKTS